VKAGDSTGTSVSTTPITATPSDKTPGTSVTGLDGEEITGTPTPTPTTNPTTTTTPAPSPGATTGSGGEALLGYLRESGFTGETLRLAWSIGMAESAGNPRAFNGNRNTGDQSYGLFQINMIGAMGPERRRALGISSNEELFDPRVNIRAMKMISSNGTNWRPWSAYTNGSYRRYYSQFRG
jgi:hypothetical protein